MCQFLSALQVQQHLLASSSVFKDSRPSHEHPQSSSPSLDCSVFLGKLELEGVESYVNSGLTVLII